MHLDDINRLPLTAYLETFLRDCKFLNAILFEEGNLIYLLCLPIESIHFSFKGLIYSL